MQILQDAKKIGLPSMVKLLNQRMRLHWLSLLLTCGSGDWSKKLARGERKL